MIRFNPTRYLFVITFIVSLFLTPSCIVDISRENCVAVTGKVEYIEEGSSYDVFVKLKDDGKRFYINRGLERGLTMASLQEELVGNEIKLWYAKHWATHGGHVTQVQLKEKIIFSEWKN